MRSIILAAVLLGLTGCSVATKQETLTPEMHLKELDNPTTQIQRSEPAIQVVEVNADNFHFEAQPIPDREIIKRAKIMGAELSDVIALLTEATNENIVFQLQSSSITSSTTQTSGSGSSTYQSNSGDDYLLNNTKVNLSASNIPFGKVLQKTVGDKLSIVYDDDTFYLGNIRTSTIKIPSITGLPGILSSSISSMGATNVTTDTITSTVSFSAREKEYSDIMKYLEILRNNLYVIEYEISIYDVQLKDNYALGIDWSLVPTLAKDGLSFVASAGAGLGAAGASAVPATFGMILKNDTYNGKALVSALENFGKVESVQRPKLLGLAGTTVKLTDGIESPYISGIQNTTVSGSGASQVSTTSATALSGLEINLKSNMLDGTVITDIGLKINDIVGYTSFQVNGNTFSQPQTVTKAINNTMRVQPGVPIVISGLFRNKSDKGWDGLPGLGDSAAGVLGGERHTSSTKSEMVIVVTPRVIKYVMK